MASMLAVFILLFVQTLMQCQERMDAWNTEVTQVIWKVKWSAKGLQPAQPMVILKAGLTLKLGMVCQVVGTPAATS